MTLMIIDMQPEFLNLAPSDDLVAAVVDQIHGPTIVVEMVGGGRTDSRIMKALQDFVIVEKYYDSVLNDLPPRAIDLVREELRVCGVNTNACVQASVMDMHRVFPWWFRLIKRGCRNMWGEPSCFAWTYELERVLCA